MRLIFVTRRFWPLFGDAENAIGDLSAGLREAGVFSTVLTARWERRWSDHFIYRGVPVIRLPNPQMPGWGRLRYQSSLGGWLRDHREDYDLVCVSRMPHCAATVLDVARKTRKPVVIRMAGSGAAGDCPWRARSWTAAALLSRCREADALTVPCAEAKRKLLEAGCLPPRVHVIAEGVPPVGLRGSSSRSEAREALAEINGDLQLEADAPLAVCAGGLSADRGLKRLLAAWPAVLRAVPAARLWLIGDGPLRDELHRLRKDLGVAHAVQLPGTFEDLEGVLRAANLLVDPCPFLTEPRAVLEAVTARLPLVLADPRPPHSTLGDDHVRWCETTDPATLSRAVIAGLQSPADSEALSAARGRVLERHGLDEMVRRYRELFEALVAVRGGG